MRQKVNIFQPGYRRPIRFQAAACLALGFWSPAPQSQAPAIAPPKLVVVISIDQLRADYLQRFRRYFAPGGFNLLLGRGANFTAAHYQHAVTQTCPGHAVILTGSYPNRNGIVANSWYDPALRKAVYCAADTTAKLIGVNTEGRSPRNLVDSTVGDRLKRASGGRSRVISIAGKDRSAIMLGGHLADAAYWTEDTLLVSSRYYMSELPAWVQRFNAAGNVTRYQGATWDRVLPAAAYQELVGPDDVPAEQNVAGMGRTFPHQLGTGRSSPADFLEGFQTSPFENEVLVDFAIEAVRQEELGRHEIPDLLAVGFSANDPVGHAYGPDSHEVMDMTIRTDRALERLFGFLEDQVGLDSVLIVLTADHGVAPLPERPQGSSNGARGARLDPATLTDAAENALRARFGQPRRPAWMTPPAWIMYRGWPWLYLNLPGLQDKRISVQQAERIAQRAMQALPGVERVLTASELRQQRNRSARSRAELSFYPGRSGNLYYELAPYVVHDAQPEGTNHGSPWDYDTHVPLLWFGGGIRPGTYEETVSIADVAPTLSALLRIRPPAGSQGRVLAEMLASLTAEGSR